MATFFPTQEDFRAWLEQNHKKETELIVGFYKVNSGKPSMTWPQAVDQALCFGWIDGIRKSIDNESYSNRFTPRRPNSIWSAVNIKKVEELTAKGLMRPEGLAAYEKIKDGKTKIYGYEKKAENLPEEFENQFKINATAWEFFNKQAPSYQRTVIHWITSAKQEKTKLSRLQKAIAESEMQRRFF